MSGASGTWGIARASARAHAADLVGTALVLGLAGSVVSVTGVLVESGLRAGPDGDGGALSALASSFAGTAMVVVLMVVTSTVGLALRQRRREIALMRTVGATAEQVRRLVSCEVVLVALASVPLGAVCGAWSARLLTPLLVEAGMVAPGYALSLTPLPVLGAVALLVPTALVAGRLAARESVRTPPSTAVRSSTVESHDIGGVRRVCAVLLAVSGLSAALSPLLVPGVIGAAAAASSAFLLVGAVACAGPLLVHAVFGRAARLASSGGHGTARLALSNVHGYSRRLTAVVVPLALVVATGTVSSSVDRAVERAAHEQLSDAVGGDLVAVLDGPVDASELSRLTDDLTDDGAVSAAASLGSLSAAVRTDPDDLPDALVWEQVALRVVDPATPATLLDPGVTRGSLTGLGEPDTVAIGTDTAFELGLAVGDRVQLRLGTSSGDELHDTFSSRVVAVYERGLGLGQYVVGPATPAAHGVAAPIETILVSGAPRASVTEVRAAITSALGPGVSLSTTREWVAEATSPEAATQRLSSVLLLALLLFVALGAGNAVALSTRNRRDELSLLARTGATRRQLMWMLATEALVTAGLAWLVGTLAVLPAVLAVSLALLGPVVPVVAWVTYGALSVVAVALSLVACLAAGISITRSPHTPARTRRAATRAASSISA